MIVTLPVYANDVNWESFCKHTSISNDKSVKSKVCGFLVYKFMELPVQSMAQSLL